MTSVEGDEKLDCLAGRDDHPLIDGEQRRAVRVGAERSPGLTSAFSFSRFETISNPPLSG
jgi:hypothetical protein